MLDTKGNTTVYLLYTHACLESILAKAKAEHNMDIVFLVLNETEILITHPSERIWSTIVYMHSFTDMIMANLVDLFPCHVCNAKRVISMIHVSNDDDVLNKTKQKENIIWVF